MVAFEESEYMLYMPISYINNNVVILPRHYTGQTNNIYLIKYLKKIAGYEK